MNVIVSILVTCGLLTVSPAYGRGLTTDVERSALVAWDQYTRCEETLTYRPCFDLLSAAARRGWTQQRGVTNSNEYEEQKLRNDYADLRLTLLHAKRSGATVTLRVLVSGLNEGLPFLTYQEYVLVRERGRWKIDRVEVQGKVMLP